MIYRSFGGCKYTVLVIVYNQVKIDLTPLYHERKVTTMAGINLSVSELSALERSLAKGLCMEYKIAKSHKDIGLKNTITQKETRKVFNAVEKLTSSVNLNRGYDLGYNGKRVLEIAANYYKIEVKYARQSI